MQRSREWKLQNQETNMINKAFQQSHFFTYIPFTKSISVLGVSVGQQPLCSFFKKLLNVYVKISKRRHGTVLFSEAVKFTQIHKEAQS